MSARHHRLIARRRRCGCHREQFEAEHLPSAQLERGESVGVDVGDADSVRPHCLVRHRARRSQVVHAWYDVHSGEAGHPTPVDREG